MEQIRECSQKDVRTVLIIRGDIATNQSTISSLSAQASTAHAVMSEPTLVQIRVDDLMP